MFKSLKEKIKNIFNKKDNIINNKITEAEEKILDKEVLTVNISDWIEIDIKEECTLSEYSKNMKKNEEIYNMFIPFKIHFTTTPGVFNSYTKIIKQKIYIIEKNNLKFFITITDNQVQIFQYKTLENNIYETYLQTNFTNYKYRIIKSIHDLNYSTGQVKWYPCKGDMVKYFSLDKSEAHFLLKDLLENIKRIKNIEEKLDIEKIFITLSETFTFENESVINDEVISLAPYPFKINNEIKHQFDIILNKTQEKVGYISYDYSCDVKGKYNIGNVFYGIKEECQNKGYATRALKLLKKYLQGVQLDFDKDLYFYVNYYNEASKKVILNNGGEIIEPGNPYENEGNGKAHILKIKM